jgi:hypothetical protein
VVADPEHVEKALAALVAVYQYLSSSPNGAIARYWMKGSDVDIALSVVAGHWIPAGVLARSRDSLKAFEVHHQPTRWSGWVVVGLSLTLDVSCRGHAVWPMVYHSPRADELVHQSNLAGEGLKAMDECERADSGERSSLGQIGRFAQRLWVASRGWDGGHGA